MPKSVTVEEIIQLVEALPPLELTRLLRLIAVRKEDSLIYAAIPAGSVEFSADDELLAWDSGGLGERELTRGEIRWYTFRPPDKRRPILVLTRNEVIERLNEIIVVPATRTIRGLATELVLTPDDGMPVPCALNFDHIALAQRERIGEVLGYLPHTRWLEARRALLLACGFTETESN